MTSDYVLVRNETQVAYMLETYEGEATVAEMIRQSTAACHVSQCQLPPRKKRYLGDDVVYGVE